MSSVPAGIDLHLRLAEAALSTADEALQLNADSPGENLDPELTATMTAMSCLATAHYAAATALIAQAQR